MPGLIVKPRSRIFHGHDWVYSTEVMKIFGVPTDGDEVALKSANDQFLGTAIYNSRSHIVARRFSRGRQELDGFLFRKRIEAAVEYRRRHGVNERLCRLVWSESDGLPGVIVDRYGDYLVLQTLTLAMDRRRELIVETLRDLLQPKGIIERNDSNVRLAEGLEHRSGLIYGEAPGPFAVSIHGLEFEIDLMHGQKTGLYLDQIANYPPVAAYANGRRVLDCFSNAGGFALTCAKAGAREVHAVDLNADCVSQIQRNAERNGLKIDAKAANVFDLFKELERRKEVYDLIVLDPPSFTKTRGKLIEARRGYKEIHLRAFKLLAPDGILATFSCSHHMTAEFLLDVINDAAVDARRSARVLARFSQALDHPITLGVPETEYLKGFLFEVAER
jgi:23S rRNA (cytosine1962-C5)-methyltransferase